MGFAAPAWLWLLVPWAALVVLTLRAYRQIIAIPFLQLWPREEAAEEKRRAWRVPPLPLVLLLIALLLSIAALARPWAANGQPRLERVVIVLDRGVGMLADDHYAKAKAAMLAELRPLLHTEAQVRVLDPLEPERLVGPAGLDAAMDRFPTALDLKSRVDVLAERARRSGWPVIVLGTPAEETRNVGIVSATARAGECWLTLRNDSDLQRVTVLLTSGNLAERHEIELPPAGGLRSYRLNCPTSLPIRVELQTRDDLADDNNWWILPEQVPGRLHVAADAPGWMRRFVASYASARPANAFSRDVLITTRPVDAARLVLVGDGEEQLSASTRVTVDHPVLRDVVLPTVVLAGGALPAGDWTVLWEQGGRPLLAISEPARSVWIGFRPADGMTPDYLILLTNAADFCCGVRSSTAGPRLLANGWEALGGLAGEAALPGTRAGLYRHDSEYLAVNVAAPELATGARSGSIQELARGESRVMFSPWLWTAVGLLVAGAVLATAYAKRQHPR